MRTEASVKILRTYVELESVRSEWQSWAGHRESEMESYLTFVRSNRVTLRPHVLVVHRAGRPDAIMVGRIDVGHISCRLGYLRLNLPAKILNFAYGALRGNASKENCELLTDAVLRSLSEGEADAAYMNFLREDSVLCRLAKTRPGALRRDYIHVTQPHYSAFLPTTAEGFYSGLSPKSRWQVRSKQKRLLKEYGAGVRVRCFRNAAELDAMIRDVEEVATRSYQRGLGVGFVDTLMTREALRLQAEQKRLRAYVLYLKDRPAAFWIGEVSGNTFASDYLAYDSDFAKCSPGMYLITKVMEGFCEDRHEGVSDVDFALGHAQYKQVLSNRQWGETCVYVFAPSFKGLCLNFVRTVIAGSEQIIKKLLMRANLLQKVKKAWRTHAMPETTAHADA